MAIKKKQRRCRFCKKAITFKTKRTYCDSPECVERHENQHKKNEAKRRRRIALEKKRERLMASPINCDHCGKEMTTKDDLKFPVCHRCLEWWEANKSKIRKERERGKDRKDFGMEECPICGTSFKKRTYNHTYCTPHCRQAEEWRLKSERLKEEQAERNNFDFEPGDFSQEQYEKEQKELEQPNGRKCKYWENFGDGPGGLDCNPKSPEALVGNDMLYCKKHQEAVKRKSVIFRCDNNWGNESVIDWERF